MKHEADVQRVIYIGQEPHPSMREKMLGWCLYYIGFVCLVYQHTTLLVGAQSFFKILACDACPAQSWDLLSVPENI